MQTLKLEGEDKKIGGIYYFLPDPISVETVRNEIEKELGEKAKKPTTKNNSNPDSNSSSNSNEQTKKEQTKIKHQLIRHLLQMLMQSGLCAISRNKKAQSIRLGLFYLLIKVL